jgi:hypothetical protein
MVIAALKHRPSPASEPFAAIQIRILSQKTLIFFSQSLIPDIG